MTYEKLQYQITQTRDCLQEYLMEYMEKSDIDIEPGPDLVRLMVCLDVAIKRLNNPSEAFRIKFN